MMHTHREPCLRSGASVRLSRAHLVGKVAEGRKARQLDKVEPCEVKNPRLGLGLDGVQVKRATPLDEELKLGSFDNL